MPYPPGATLDLDFSTSLPAGMTFTRNGTATDSHWTDASGSSYNSYGTNIPRFHPMGMVFESQARTNYLLNSAAPATQTTGSLPAAACVLWVIGTGSATVTAGTGIASGGLGTATAGSPLYFTVTTAGTFVVTVTGSLNRFQLERGGSPTTFIPTTGTTATRAAETCNQAIGGWYSSTAGTIVGAASFLTMIGMANQGIIELSDGTTGNRIDVSQNGNVQVLVTTAASNKVNDTVAGNIVPVVAGRIYTIAVRYTAAGNARGAASGLLMPDRNAIAMPTVSQIDLPLGATATLGGTWIMNRGLYYPWAFADYELQCATAGNAMAGAAMFM